MNAQFILASGSPRRKDLLASVGYSFQVIPADIDEASLADESPERYVLRLAEEKASVIKETLPIVAADTTVVLEKKIFGKPRDEKEAAEMLKALQGRTHEVFTGVALSVEGKVRTILERTAVTFRPLNESEINHYVSSGEPLDKAGAYAAQGYGASFITRIDGSYTNVVGLPLAQTVVLLNEIGIKTGDY